MKQFLQFPKQKLRQSAKLKADRRTRVCQRPSATRTKLRALLRSVLMKADLRHGPCDRPAARRCCDYKEAASSWRIQGAVSPGPRSSLSRTPEQSLPDPGAVSPGPRSSLSRTPEQSLPAPGAVSPGPGTHRDPELHTPRDAHLISENRQRHHAVAEGLLHKESVNAVRVVTEIDRNRELSHCPQHKSG